MPDFSFLRRNIPKINIPKKTIAFKPDVTVAQPEAKRGMGKASEVILAFLSQYIPETYKAQAISEIESTGTISDATLNKAGIKKPSTVAFIKDQITQLAPTQSLKDLNQDQLRNLTGIGKIEASQFPEVQIDEANLTDEGLSTRKSLFEQLGKTGGVADRGIIERAIESKLGAYGVKDNVHALAQQITDMTLQLGRYPNADELKNAFSKDTTFSKSAGKPVESEGGNSFFDKARNFATDAADIGTGRELLQNTASGDVQGRDFLANKSTRNLANKVTSGSGDLYTRPGYLPPEVENFFNDQNARNELSGLVQGFTKSPDTYSDVQRIEDLLSGRKQAATRETELNSFIESIPQQLEAPRQERAALLRDLGGKQFDVSSEEILARENALGRLDTGAPGSALANMYGDIQGNIEGEIAGMASSDDDFYFNAAYQNQIRKLTEGRTDLASSLGMERQNVRGQQEQRFQQGQFDLNKNFQNEMLMQKYENQIKSAQMARQRQQDLQNKQKSMGTASGIGGLVGGIGGGIVGGIYGGPMGAGLGYSAGSAAGASLPLLFGSQR